MASIDINNGNAILSLTGTTITGNPDISTKFYAGSCGVTGLALWIKIVLAAGSNITKFDINFQTTNDPTEILWAPTLATLHNGAGTTNTTLSTPTLTAGQTYLFKIGVEPRYVGSARICRVIAKADVVGVAGDLINITATGW